MMLQILHYLIQPISDYLFSCFDRSHEELARELNNLIYSDSDKNFIETKGKYIAFYFSKVAFGLKDPEWFTKNDYEKVWKFIELNNINKFDYEPKTIINLLKTSTVFNKS